MKNNPNNSSVRSHLLIESIARVCHEANRAYCQTLGDNNHLSWDDSPEWVREPVRSGVQHALNNPNQTPEEVHETWLSHKTDDGWIYGPTKDPVAKTHPCCVPYSQLSENDRRKDLLFLSVVRAMSVAM